MGAILGLNVLFFNGKHESCAYLARLLRLIIIVIFNVSCTDYL